MSRIENLIKKSTDSGVWIPWVGLVIGLAFIGLSNREHPDLLWLAQLAFYLPALGRLLSLRAKRGERIALLMTAALFSYLPRIMSCSGYSCTPEEMGWWRSTQNILLGGRVLQDNPLGAIQGIFPGLPLLTAVLERVGGLNTYYSGLVLVGILHALSLFGVFLLGERMFLSSRAGAAAAALYLALPGSLVYSVQFSGGTLGGTLVIAALLAAQNAAETAHEPDRAGWGLVALALTTVIVVTHPGAALVLAVILVLMALFARLMPYGSNPTTPRLLRRLASFAVIATLAWITTLGAASISPLVDAARRGLRETGLMLPRFASLTLLPASLGLLVLLVLSFYGLRVIRRMGLPVLAASYGIMASEILFILAYPLLISGTSQGMFMPWMVSGLGGALLAGFSLAWISSARPHQRKRIQTAMVGGAAAFVPLALILVVPLQSGAINDPSQNAAPSQSLINAAEWMRSEFGAGNRVASDTNSIQVLGSYGLQDPAFSDLNTQPVVLTSQTWSLDALLSILKTRTTYFVINHNQVSPDSQVQVEAIRDANQSASPHELSSASVEKFEKLSILSRVYDSGEIVIYHLDDQTFHAKSDTAGIANTGQAAPPPTPASQPLDGEVPHNWLKSLIFVLLMLLVPGYLLGELLFYRWEKMDGLTRLVLAASLSMAAIIGTGLLAGLSPNPLDRAPWYLAGLCVAALLITLRQKAHLSEPLLNPSRAEALRWGAGALRRVAPVAAILVVGVLAPGAVMLPAPDLPKSPTEFALRDSLPLTLEISNHEGDAQFHVVVYGEGVGAIRTGEIKLKAGEMRQVSLKSLFTSFPKDGMLYIDLYKGDQAQPFRSLHLPYEQARKLAGFTDQHK